MEENKYVLADIGKIIQFAQDSAEVVQEFNSIKTEFAEINSRLLKKWVGDGADAYASETNSILEKIGGVEEVLKAINESVLKDVTDSYMALDEELGEFNRNPKTEETQQ